MKNIQSPSFGPGNTFESVTTYFTPTDTYSSVVLKDCTDIRVSGEVLKDKRVKGFQRPILYLTTALK